MEISDLKFLSCDSDPLTETEIAQLVSAIGPIPDDYKQFLLEKNGGRMATDEGVEVLIDPSRRPPGLRDRFGLRRFNVIDPQFPPPVVTGKYEGRYIRMIEVAGEYQCEILLMSLAVHSFGSIYCWLVDPEMLWDAEDAGKAYIPGDENTYYVAPSFREFLELAYRPATTKDSVDVNTMEHSVENFARYGDQCLSKATAFLDKFSVEELNGSWPKDAKYPHPTIVRALGKKQVNIVRYLISRGVNFEKYVTRFANSLEISQLLIKEAGDSAVLKQELLLKAAGTLPATSMPEAAEDIIEWLTESGVQPDFSDAKVVEQWRKCLRGIYSKKILRFLESKINFSPKLSVMINLRLNSRIDGALDSATIKEYMTPSDSERR